MNSDAALDEAIIHPDLRHINFFNGRLLTGGDLQAEQNVQHAHTRHIGLAIGVGVAEGLFVSEAVSSPPGEAAVVITAGSAVNRAGETLRLECDQRVVLARPPDPAKRDQCVFADCDELPSDRLLGSSEGYYLLTIAPASQRDGRAPVSGLGNSIASCNSRYFSEGVKFRLVSIAVNAGSDARQRQSRVAQACFGLITRNLGIDLQRGFTGAEIASGFETLVAANHLTTSDVPLAVIEWTSLGLGFIDAWSVRRRIARAPAATACDRLFGANRTSVGEAVFSQFQEQLYELSQRAGTATLAASDHFFALPPVGVVPARGTGSPLGFDAQRFLAAYGSSDIGLLDAEQLPRLLAESFRLSPVLLQNDARFQRYFVWETVRSVEAGESNQLLMVFAHQSLPYAGTARFDRSKTAESRFSPQIL